MRRWALLIILIFLASFCSEAETVKISWAKIRRQKNEHSRLLVDKDGDLKFDDAGRKTRDLYSHVSGTLERLGGKLSVVMPLNSSGFVVLVKPVVPYHSLRHPQQVIGSLVNWLRS